MTSNGAVTLTATLLDAPFRMAVILTHCVEETVPAVAVKFAVVLFACTVTEVGTGRAELLLDSPTTLPPAGAGWLSVTLQLVLAPEPTVVGLHIRFETTAGSTKVNIVVCRVPFRAAVTVALWFDGSCPAVTMKLAELVPAGMVTVLGTVSRALLSLRATTVAVEAS